MSEVLLDSRAREILINASFPGIREALCCRPPFEVSAAMTAGVSEDYLRILDLEGVSLAGGTKRLAAAIRMISRGKLPCCLKGRLEATVEAEGSLSGFNIALVTGVDSIQVNILPDGPCEGQVETWVDGELLRSIPAENLPRRPLSGLKPGCAISFRIDGASTGFSILLAPLEFGRKDWFSAAIANILSGNPSEGIRILTECEPPLIPDHSKCSRIAAFLRSIGAVTGTIHAALSPLPVLRSGMAEREGRLDLFRPVWKGIVETWPDAAGIENPWRAEAARPAGETQPLPESVRALIHAAACAALGLEIPGGALREDEPDPFVSAGWAALEGWQCLADQDFSSALESFSSVPTDPSRDPFGLFLGAELARHLLNFEKAAQAEREEASDRLWRELFDDVL
ncbi:MAG: hypothetical protein HUU16_02460 [Candidatus Omnitrophica bacterium]|nr:hypothetical protein [Candidatus Omnitrophota bacterium]